MKNALMSSVVDDMAKERISEPEDKSASRRREKGGVAYLK